VDSDQQFDPDATRTHADGREEAVGTLIGRYRLFQKIGEGGMGEVWLAEQKEPVRRRVALKLVKAGMNTREVIARSESERQALALMDHPAIARVLDAGSAPQGLPYFVMGYVAGVPITAYCDNHRLKTRERLDLFMHVCDGVQHTLLVMRNLASTLELEGKYSQAEALFRRRLESNHDNPASLNALAWYLVAVPDRRQRRPAEALQLARLAVKGAPSVATDYNTLGLAAYRNDLWAEAVANLRRAIAADSGEDPTDFFFLAMTEWKQGNAREAEIDFARGVDGASKGAADNSEWRMFWPRPPGF
jgi:tetratricopeptide (TPR) repeat protein